MLQHNNKKIEMILPQPQNNYLWQLSKNTSKKHNEKIEQLCKQQEVVPKTEEATVSTKPTEPTTQTPSTSTSFIDTNNLVSPLNDRINDEENPQDNVLNRTTIELDDYIPEYILSLLSSKEPPSNNPPKQHNDKAILHDTNKPFLNPNQSNHTTHNTIRANFVQQDIAINLLDKHNLIQENYLS